jgi:hypothetical protein
MFRARMASANPHKEADVLAKARLKSKTISHTPGIVMCLPTLSRINCNVRHLRIDPPLHSDIRAPFSEIPRPRIDVIGRLGTEVYQEISVSHAALLTLLRSTPDLWSK